MAETPTRILVADDEEETLFAVKTILEDAGFSVVGAEDGERALALARERAPEILLLDVSMPRLTGLEAVRQVREDPALRFLPVLLLTGRGEVDDIVAGFAAGADDYLIKPPEPEELLARIRAALRTRSLYQQLYHSLLERDFLKEELKAARGASSILGQSSAIKELHSLIEKVASSDVPVLIRGESGTGKELVARELHEQSPRAKKPFVVQNCAALQEHLLESALFGHARGAFTGAARDKAGLFQVAHEGTFFLDEIGEMSLPLQAKLLRVVQEGTFLPVGETKERKVDVRIVAATHRPLEEMIARGEFREDLFYRLNVVPLSLPPLRERREDIPALCAAFLEQIRERLGRSVPNFSPEALRLLQQFEWPGNIRQLKNEVERCVIFGGSSPLIGPELVSVEVTQRYDEEGVAKKSAKNLAHKTLPQLVEEVERGAITHMLKECGGNKSEAARRLEISRSSLISKVQQYKLE